MNQSLEHTAESDVFTENANMFEVHHGSIIQWNLAPDPTSESVQEGIYDLRVLIKGMEEFYIFVDLTRLKRPKFEQMAELKRVFLDPKMIYLGAYVENNVLVRTGIRFALAVIMKTEDFGVCSSRKKALERLSKKSGFNVDVLKSKS